MNIGRTDAEAEAPIPPDVKSSLEKALMLGKIDGQRIRGQQRMRWLDGIIDSMDEFEQTQADSDGLSSLDVIVIDYCREPV